MLKYSLAVWKKKILNNLPLVSVVIPCYNVEDYIEECLDSVFAQTYRNIEVIAVDNNSTDKTYDVLKSYKRKKPALILLKEKNKGAPFARNTGFGSSQGQWIQFLDADDLLLPNKIKHQVKMVNPDSPFLVSPCFWISKFGSQIYRKVGNCIPLIDLYYGNLGNTCSNLWNRQYISKVNGWDESRKSSQEAWLMFSILRENDKIQYDNEALTIIRQRRFGQISQQNDLNNLLRFFELRCELLEWIKANRKKIFKEYQKSLNDKLFELIRMIAQHDISKGKDLLNKYFGLSYKPYVSNKNKFFYKILYNIFGFENTERIWQSLKMLGKFLLKNNHKIEN